MPESYSIFALSWSSSRSSRRRCSIKKAVLKNFTIFTGKHLCWSLFLTKLQASIPYENFWFSDVFRGYRVLQLCERLFLAILKNSTIKFDRVLTAPLTKSLPALQPIDWVDWAYYIVLEIWEYKQNPIC